jgi:hypothetical protein
MYDIISLHFMNAGCENARCPGRLQVSGFGINILENIHPSVRELIYKLSKHIKLYFLVKLATT